MLAYRKTKSKQIRLHVLFCGDDLLQAAPHDRMVIYDNHSDHPAAPP
jgi:hypothetical protein